MRKRVLFVLIALFAIGQYSFAFDFAAVAPSGQTLYYSYTNGVNGNSVYVTYPGTDWSHNYDGYTRPAGALTIPSIVSNGSKDYTVTSIGGYAFRDVECYAFDACIGLTSVTIPNSVTSIGDCAFGECLGLTSVTIPNSVTSIGAQAFNRVRHIEYYGTAHIEYLGTTGYPWGAYSMNGVTVGDFIYADASKATLLAYIGNSAEVTIPSTVTSINEGAFQNCSSLTSVTIGNSVTSIGYDAFRNCSGLASVTIGNSVTSIGYRAFWACRGLTSVTIGNSVASIGHSAFYGCSSLTSVTIPNSVTSMDDRVFYGCSGLTTVTISNSLTRISWESFSGCTGLTSVTIPNSVTGIGPQAFYGCSGLTSVTIPSSVTTIEDYAFYSCIGLASVVIPSSVTAISGYAFYEVRHIEYYGTATGEPWGAYSMNGVTEGDFVYADASRTTLLAYIGNSAEVNIPSTVTLIDVGAFSGCSSLTSVTIGNSVTRIGNYAFKNCSGLTSVTIGNSLANIGREAFSGCSGLTSIVVESGNTHYDSRENCNAVIQTNNNLLVCGCQNTIIPNSVTSIGANAFSGCSSLTSVTIPNSVTGIGIYAFSGCTGLTSIECQATVPPTTNANTFEDVPTGIPVHIPCVTLSDYQAAAGWSSFTNYIEGNVFPFSVTANTADNTMGTAAVTTAPNCTNNTATITATANCGYQFVHWSNGSTDNPYTLTITQDTSLTAVFEAAETTHIALTVTSGQTLYFNINCANNTATVVSEYNNYPYYTTRPTGNITIPSCIEFNNETYPVTAIGENAFGFCSNITSVTVPSSVTIISACAFSNCYNIESITISGAVTEIGHEAFISCNRLSSFTIPNTVSSIDWCAFEACYDLTSITIPASVTSIGRGVFSHCRNLTSIIVDANNSVYDSRNNCNAIIRTSDNVLIGGCNTTVIPNTVTAIANSAFEGLTNLTSITIPASVLSIGNYAFYASGLTSIEIPNSVIVINEGAFLNCNSLASVSFPSSLTTLKRYAFQGCSALTSLTIPNNITSIEESAFGECGGLTSIVVSAGNPNYDSRNNCNAIIETTTNTLIAGSNNTVIPPDVTSLGKKTFFGCHMTSFTIPASVTFIDDYAFFACYNLSEINLLAENPPTLGNNDVFFGVGRGNPVYVPCGSIAAYQAATGWSDFTNIQERFSYTLTANTADNNMGTAAVTTEPSCANNTATITATANSGHRFDHWSDGVIINPRSVTVTSDTAFTAIFEYAGTHGGSSQPTPAVSCGEYLWPAVPSPNAEVQIKQKHDHTSAYASQGWDTLVSANSPTIELSCMPYIPVQFFNGQYTVDLIPYNPPDTTFRAGTQVPLSSSDDRFSNPAITLSFPFYFFGERKNGFVVGSNGMMSFNTAAAGQYCAYYYSAPLPWPDGTSGAPNQVSYMRDAIYGVYEDTYPNPSQISGGDGIYYGVQDIYPGRKIICSWNSIPLYSCTNYRSSYQIVCYEGTNIIEVHVKQRQACPSFNGGHGIIGIQNATGQSQVQGPSNSSTHYVVTGSPAAFYPAGKNIFTTNLTETAYRFTPQGTTSYNYAWYRVYDDGRASVELTTDPSDPNGYYIPMDDGSSCPTLTRAVVNPTEPAKYVFELRFQDANNDTYILYDTCTVGYLSANTVTLTATSANETMGTVDGGGIYSAGFSATITATANSGYRFDHWSDGNTDNPRTITVTSDTTISAIFAQAGSSCDTISNQTNVSINNNICQVTCCTGQTILCSIDNERHTATVTGYTECEGEMKIPEAFMVENTMYTITAIGPRAFYACSGLTAVHLPITVVTYGEKAFAECPLLGTMTYKVRAAQQ